jgi:hypothetical protein
MKRDGGIGPEMDPDVTQKSWDPSNMSIYSRFPVGHRKLHFSSALSLNNQSQSQSQEKIQSHNLKLDTRKTDQGNRACTQHRTMNTTRVILQHMAPVMRIQIRDSEVQIWIRIRILLLSKNSKKKT